MTGGKDGRWKDIRTGASGDKQKRENNPGFVAGREEQVVVEWIGGRQAEVKFRQRVNAQTHTEATRDPPAQLLSMTPKCALHTTPMKEKRKKKETCAGQDSRLDGDNWPLQIWAGCILFVSSQTGVGSSPVRFAVNCRVCVGCISLTPRSEGRLFIFRWKWREGMRSFSLLFPTSLFSPESDLTQ